MKCKELMVGDWVSQYGFQIQIDCVGNGYAIFLDNEAEPHLIEDEDYNIEPIPLTPEILEKNGWEHNGVLMEKRADENTLFSWTDKCGAVLYQNKYHMNDCRYVHTLQHAFRLCGFDELADNFKI